MVHVEIWLGDGDKTIGARWQRGKVQVNPTQSIHSVNDTHVDRLVEQESHFTGHVIVGEC